MIDSHAPRILTVCEGNICRSPFAEQSIRELLFVRGIRASVESAGLRALVGHPMDDLMEEVASAYLHEVKPHAGMQLNKDLLLNADAILTMTREQRDAVLRVSPRVIRTTFTLAEFVALLEGIGIDKPMTFKELVLEMSSKRFEFVGGPHDDIEDPYKKQRATFEAVADQIYSLTAALADGLGRRGASF